MNRKILRLAIPNIVSNLSVPLLSTVDTALMGRMESETYIGAVALGALIYNFVYWGFGFLRMGTTGLTAQALGQQNNGAIIHTLGRALIVVMSAALLLITLQVPIRELSFGLISGSAEVEVLARQYFDVRIWAAPATLGLYAFMGWFLGMQNALYPMLLTIVINVVNIFANFILIYQFGMKADGVALGTVIAQYVGLIIAIGMFYKRYRSYLVAFRLRAVIELAPLRRFLAVNGDIFIRTFFLIFVLSFFTERSAASGDMILAVNAVLLQYVTWLSYGIDGFAFAAESLIGKYAGAKNNQLLKRSIRLTFIWGMGLAILFTLTYVLAGRGLLTVFTDQTDVIEQAIPYLIWIVLMPLIASPCYLWDGVYIGLTASRAMRNSMLISFGLFVAGYAIITYGTDTGNHGLWLSLMIFMAARGIIQSWWYFQGKVKSTYPEE